MAEDCTNPTGETRVMKKTPAPVRHLNALERRLENAGDHLWAELRKRPYVGSAIAGGVGLALASAVGIAELAAAGGAAYACFLVLKRRESPAKAIRDAFQLEKECFD